MKFRGVSSACIQAGTLPLAPLGFSGLTSRLKYKIKRPGSGHPSQSVQICSWLETSSSSGWISVAVSASSLNRSKKGVWAPKSMASLLKILPRKSADARILILNE